MKWREARSPGHRRHTTVNTRNCYQPQIKSSKTKVEKKTNQWTSASLKFVYGYKFSHLQGHFNVQKMSCDFWRHENAYKMKELKKIIEMKNTMMAYQGMWEGNESFDMRTTSIEFCLCTVVPETRRCRTSLRTLPPALLVNVSFKSENSEQTN